MAEHLKIDWQNSQSHLLINPRWPQAQQEQAQSLFRQVPSWPAHVWIATSGSTQTDPASFKLVGLSKHALLASAAAVNRHLKSNQNDAWLLALPTFHVGGLGIFTRAHLSNAKVVTLPEWNATEFAHLLLQEKITLTALVPTQVYDLVKARLTAPKHLRAIVVGGAALPYAQWLKARELGWPVLPSYGMSECCSQVATAGLECLQSSQEPELMILDHVSACTNQDQHLGLQSEALLSAYGQIRNGEPHFWDPRENGIFWAEDRVELNRNRIRVLGRDQDLVKVAGELVNLASLNKTLQGVLERLSLAASGVVVAVPNERLGYEVALVWESQEPKMATQVCELFNQAVAPYARIRRQFCVPTLPRTALGKLIQPELLKLILC